MFNVGGGEILAILVIALIVLGPDKLPNAARQAGKYLNEFRRISSGFQDEIRGAMDLATTSTTDPTPIVMEPAEPGADPGVDPGEVSSGPGIATETMAFAPSEHDDTQNDDTQNDDTQNAVAEADVAEAQLAVSRAKLAAAEADLAAAEARLAAAQPPATLDPTSSAGSVPPGTAGA